MPATSAALGYPSAVAVDSAGNVYIGDKNGYGIRKVNTAGICRRLCRLCRSF